MRRPRTNESVERRRGSDQIRKGKGSRKRVAINELETIGLKRTELPDLEAARLAAIKDARSLMSEAVRVGHDITSRSIEVRNEAGGVLLFVPFSEAIKRVG